MTHEHEKPKPLPTTASKLMIPVDRVPVATLTTSIRAIKKLIQTRSDEFKIIDYIYVTDNKGHAHGVISIKELFIYHHDDKTAQAIMKHPIITVYEHVQQKHIAHTALEHNIKAVPVVTTDNVLVGVVPPNTILLILDKEQDEKLLHDAGIQHTNGFDDPLHLTLLTSIRHRLPWLLIGLLGGLLTAGIIGSFEETLSENLIIAAFIPLIVYMADAIGTQMEAFIIRDLAINPRLQFIRYLGKQLLVVFVIGSIISVTLGFSSYFFYHDSAVSEVLSIALFFAILSSVFSGLIIPYIFARLKQDPANASGPVATIIQDVMSIVVYFAVATWLL